MRVYLDFEKPIADLESKIEELRRLSGDSTLNILDEVGKLEKKLERMLRETYSALNIDSTKYEIIGFVKSGYPAAVPKVSKLSVNDISVYLD